jgi:hypothetical protein
MLLHSGRLEQKMRITEAPSGTSQAMAAEFSSGLG